MAVQAAPNPATVPDDFAETISVANSGPTEATSVRVAILLPLGAELVDVEGEGFSEQCPGSGPGSFTVTLCWDLVQAGASVAATVVLAPLAGAPPTLETNLVVSAHTPDPDATNNRTTTVAPLAPFHPGPGVDLIAFVSSPRLVSPRLIADTDRYIVVPFAIGNRGRDEALGAHLVLTVTGPVTNGAIGFGGPGGLTIGPCEPTDQGTLDCSVRSVKSGGRASGYFYAQLTGAGEVRVTMRAVSATTDANTGDNTATATFQAG